MGGDTPLKGTIALVVVAATLARFPLFLPLRSTYPLLRTVILIDFLSTLRVGLPAVLDLEGEGGEKVRGRGRGRGKAEPKAGRRGKKVKRWQPPPPPQRLLQRRWWWRLLDILQALRPPLRRSQTRRRRERS